MLSEQAFHERRWGEYPHLDNLLGGNQPSMHWHGPTSVSSNIFNRVDDLLHVYALVADRHEEIQRLSHESKNDNLRRDLGILSEHLNGMSEFFKDASNRVRQY